MHATCIVIDEDGPAAASAWAVPVTATAQMLEPPVNVTSEAKKNGSTPIVDNAEQGRFKIGYISERFGRPAKALFDHVVMSMFNLHNPIAFDVHAYIVGKRESDFWPKHFSEKVRFVDLTRFHHTDAYHRIVKDELDMLIILDNLNEPCNWQSIVCNPAAPIHIVWSESVRTAGIEAVEYIVVDKITVPKILRDSFTETLAFMPDSLFVADYSNLAPCSIERAVPDFTPNDTETTDEESEGTMTRVWDWMTSWFDPEPHPAETSIDWNDLDIEAGVPGREDWASIHHLMRGRAEWGLPERAIVYCNFSRSLRLESYTIRLWSKILRKVPNSVLWLLCQPADEARQLLASFYDHGIYSERIFFATEVDMETHIPRVQLADIMLDNPTRNVASTSLDALWVGTPIVAMIGETTSTRITSSQLAAMSCDHMLTRDSHEYYKLAVELGTDNAYLRKVRHRIWKARRSSSLFDMERYCRNFESLLQLIWQHHQENEQNPSQSEE